MRRVGAVCAMLALALPSAAVRGAEARAQAMAALPSSPSAAAAPSARLEVRSSDFLAVATVRGAEMTIHLSRLADNAPVRDAAVSVMLRGTSHAATAASEGGYTLRSADLAIPGPAAVLIEIAEGPLHEQLSGTLEIASGATPREEHNSSRQIAWWVLNFAVCIGFLMLWNRRRGKSPDT